MRVTRKYTKKSRRLVKLFVQSSQVQVKIEPNELIRGTIYPVEKKNIVSAAAEEFSSFVNMQVLSIADLYGGKICAALDRQHPRDLFDIKLLLENEGITEEIRKAFVVYLASHNRPIHELLNPNFLDIADLYEKDFAGMTTPSVTLNELLLVRNELIATLNNTLTDDERKFLISLKLAEPEWDLLGISEIDKFPAIQWKLQNISKIDPAKHRLLINKLKRGFGIIALAFACRVRMKVAEFSLSVP